MFNLKQIKIIQISLLMVAVLILPAVVLAETLSSPNFSIENPSVDMGGEESSSGNYSVTSSVSDSDTAPNNSTTYSVFSGFMPHAYPGVPAPPTLTNTGGSLYNSLDFVIATGGNPSDTNYAIAISDDSFVTTYFIQTDDTLGTTEAWQTYSGWSSGLGERVVGLSPNTTYEIKVKARFGPNSETGYSQTASAATVGASLTVSIGGVASGQVIAGLTTTTTSTSTTMGFNSLSVGDGNPNIAAQTVTVSTNAIAGYVTTIQQDGNLRTSSADEIATVSGTNAVPDVFGTGVTTGRFGYHSTDASLCSGSISRFNVNDTFAALTSTPLEVSCNTAPASSELTEIVFKLVIGNDQEAGNYQNIITYITTAVY